METEHRAMKWITAIVKPARLDALRRALQGIGVSGMTVSEVRGCGRQKGRTELYRGAEYAVAFLPKIKIEVAVNEERVHIAVETMKHAARTGAIGDGKIFVGALDEALRIRTGERGVEAL